MNCNLFPYHPLKNNGEQSRAG